MSFSVAYTETQAINKETTRRASRVHVAAKSANPSGADSQAQAQAKRERWERDSPRFTKLEVIMGSFLSKAFNPEVDIGDLSGKVIVVTGGK